MNRRILYLVVSVLLLVIPACSSGSTPIPSQTPLPSETPTYTPKPASTPKPTSTPEPTATLLPTPDILRLERDYLNAFRDVSITLNNNMQLIVNMIQDTETVEAATQVCELGKSLFLESQTEIEALEPPPMFINMHTIENSMIDDFISAFDACIQGDLEAMVVYLGSGIDQAEQVEKLLLEWAAELLDE